ncbi:hypothetical protein SAMN04488065_1221 [Haloplanus vescus]|uniref:DUF7344 domain-containing protein n=1 Tax=Haloplanus vescus TaxID=555874 RepID=A0A1H3WXT0_9EURY|nr:hypothetical protein [Haloplanus vescus]SDZ91986.1 hypothetical protein SAMN04488065_1221 [Haloplanus vescus]
MGGADGSESSGVPEASRPTATLLLTDDETTVDAHLDVDPMTNVLVVSAARTMRDVVEAWRQRAGTVPATLGVVTYAEFDRSASATDGPSRRSLSGGDVTLTSMSDPSDLRRLGTAITLYLDDWADADREALVYLDALAPFLDASDAESGFQLLHLLVQSAARADASVVVRVDTSAVDEQTIRTVQSLFDEVCTPAATDDPDFRTLLSNRRRRFVLRTLLDASVSCLELERLATLLARHEHDDPSGDDWNRAYTALASIHVPRLAEANLVAFDREDETVRLTEGDWSAERLDRLLTDEYED